MDGGGKWVRKQFEWEGQLAGVWMEVRMRGVRMRGVRMEDLLSTKAKQNGSKVGMEIPGLTPSSSDFKVRLAV